MSGTDGTSVAEEKREFSHQLQLVAGGSTGTPRVGAPAGGLLVHQGCRAADRGGRKQLGAAPPGPPSPPTCLDEEELLGLGAHLVGGCAVVAAEVALEVGRDLTERRAGKPSEGTKRTLIPADCQDPGSCSCGCWGPLAPNGPVPAQLPVAAEAGPSPSFCSTLTPLTCEHTGKSRRTCS